MKTYCLSCERNWLKKVAMPNNVIRDKSRCAICSSDKSRFSKQRPNKNLIKSTIKKVVAIILILKVLYTKHYKPC